jgi:hypothetical protein
MKKTNVYDCDVYENGSFVNQTLRTAAGKK